MKHTVWMAVLVTMFLATGVPAQEAGKGGEHVPTVDEMERHERSLELRASEAELEHAQKLREMELQEREAHLERERRGKSHRDHGGGLLVLILLINILLTVWVFKDMHEQKIGRALWVPIVLLTGIFGAILYAIVRNADTRPKPAQGPGEGGQAA